MTDAIERLERIAKGETEYAVYVRGKPVKAGTSAMRADLRHLLSELAQLRSATAPAADAAEPSGAAILDLFPEPRRCSHPICSLPAGTCDRAGGRTERFSDCPSGPANTSGDALPAASDGRKPEGGTGLTWRRFRDEKPKRDGMVAEQHLLTWNVRVATYDHGCITSDWQHGEEIDGHPDDLWCWLPTDPEPPALAANRIGMDGTSDPQVTPGMTQKGHSPMTRTEGVKLTKAEESLLRIARHSADDPSAQWQPRSDHAHAKHQPTLLILRQLGFVQFSDAKPVVRITPAGRQALAKETGR